MKICDIFGSVNAKKRILNLTFGPGAGYCRDGVPAVWMGGCCPLVSALSRLGWRL